MLGIFTQCHAFESVFFWGAPVPALEEFFGSTKTSDGGNHDGISRKKTLDTGI